MNDRKESFSRIKNQTKPISWVIRLHSAGHTPRRHRPKEHAGVVLGCYSEATSGSYWATWTPTKGVRQTKHGGLVLELLITAGWGFNLRSS